MRLQRMGWGCWQRCREMGIGGWWGEGRGFRLLPPPACPPGSTWHAPWLPSRHCRSPSSGGPSQERSGLGGTGRLSLLLGLRWPRWRRCGGTCDSVCGSNTDPHPLTSLNHVTLRVSGSIYSSGPSTYPQSITAYQARWPTPTDPVIALRTEGAAPVLPQCVALPPALHQALAQPGAQHPPRPCRQEQTPAADLRYAPQTRLQIVPPLSLQTTA